jgi:hypothetical protein
MNLLHTLHEIPLRSFLILYPHLRLKVYIGLFNSGFLLKLCVFFFIISIPHFPISSAKFMSPFFSYLFSYLRHLTMHFVCFYFLLYIHLFVYLFMPPLFLSLQYFLLCFFLPLILSPVPFPRGQAPSGFSALRAALHCCIILVGSPQLSDQGELAHYSDVTFLPICFR